MVMKVNYERQMVAKEQGGSVDFEYDTLEKVLEKVKQLIKDYGKDAKIMLRCDSYSDSDKETMYVYTEELETDAEMTNRIWREERRKKEYDDRDAAEFKRLQEKFGTK